MTTSTSPVPTSYVRPRRALSPRAERRMLARALRRRDWKRRLDWIEYTFSGPVVSLAITGAATILIVVAGVSLKLAGL